MSAGVTIKGLDEVLQTFRNMAPAVGAAVDTELTAYVTDVAADAKRNAPKDRGTMAGSIHPKTDEYLVKSVIVNSPYAAWREFGTGNYAAQYVATLPKEWQDIAREFQGKTGGSFTDFVAALEGWVKRKGIGAKSMNLKNRKANYGANAAVKIKSIAYAIAISIYKNGSQAQPFLYPAATANLPQLISRLQHLTVTNSYVQRPVQQPARKIVTI